MENGCFSFCEALNEKFSLQGEIDGLENIVIESYQCFEPNLNKMKVIGLDHCSVSRCGVEGDIKKTCPLVQELDLSSNLIEEWNEILNITKQLEHLNFVNISHNPLKSGSLSSPQHKVQENVKKLALNNTQVDFETLFGLLELFPSLVELHMSVNGFTEIPNEVNTIYKNVKLLYVAKNDIKDWEEIRKIGKIFPNLVSLNISDNPVESIMIKENHPHHFENLEKLNIMNTKINEWEFIENLKNISKLKELRVKGSPVYDKKSLTEKQHRLLTVARLPKLEKLNGSPIDSEERDDAERMFIRFYMENENKPQRYQELVNTHGILDDLAEVNFNKSLIIDVIVNGDVESQFLYKVDCGKTVQTLYNELGAKLKLKKGKFKLIHIEQEEQASPLYVGCVMGLKARRVSQYYIREGDCIKVMRLDLED